MTRFRWITICRALDVLEKCLNNAPFLRLFEEYGLGDDLEADKGYSLTTPRLHGLLLKYLRRSPDRRDTEGNLVSEEMVRQAARHVGDLTPMAPLFPGKPKYLPEKPEITAFRDSLAVDGWTVQNQTLVLVAPVPFDEPRSRLRSNLNEPVFNDARSRLDQLEAALDGGNWEAANGIARGFLAALFVAICQSTSGEVAPREESAARRHLTEVGFFGATRQGDKNPPEADFVFKMSAMMGTEGVHAGETTPEKAAYRYALALLTADHYLDRLKTGLHRSPNVAVL